MPPRVLDHPTVAEMEILQVLWRIDRATVREVRQELSRLRPTGYTTALKLLQTMKDKRLVGRGEREKAHVYWALIAEREVRTRVLRGVVERVFGGSLSSLVVHAVAHAQARVTEGRMKSWDPFVLQALAASLLACFAQGLVQWGVAAACRSACERGPSRPVTLRQAPVLETARSGAESSITHRTPFEHGHEPPTRLSFGIALIASIGVSSPLTTRRSAFA